MPKSPTKRRPVTVAAVLDAGLHTFLERGFHQASIHDITAAAGLTRGAFYSNFPTKEALFLAVYDRKTDEMLAEFHQILRNTPSDGDPVPVLLAYAAKGGAGGDNWFLALAEFTVHAARNAEVRTQFTEHRDRFTAKLSDLITNVAAATNRRLDTDVDDLADVILALHEGTAMLRVSRRPGAGTDALFERMAAVILDALTPVRDEHR
ncbi:MAG: TetR/AcrR family transcriptional regulator [Mycobacterium sp.]